MIWKCYVTFKMRSMKFNEVFLLNQQIFIPFTRHSSLDLVYMMKKCPGKVGLTRSRFAGTFRLSGMFRLI